MGEIKSATTIYEWCRRWDRCHDGKRIDRRIVRVLQTMADRVGRVDTRGRPWLWRLREPVQKPSEN